MREEAQRTCPVIVFTLQLWAFIVGFYSKIKTLKL